MDYLQVYFTTTDLENHAGIPFTEFAYAHTSPLNSQLSQVHRSQMWS